MFQLRSILGFALMGAAVAATASYTALPFVSPFASQPQEGDVAMEAMPQASKHHELILKGVGKYEGTLSMSMPGMEMSEKATDEVVAIGPFHTMSHFKCSFMGMAFDGMGSMSYDPEKEVFIGMWLDSMTPGPVVMEGSVNDAMDSIEMTWEAQVMGAGDLVPHRSVTTWTADGYKATFFQGEGDSELQTMTIDMKRKK